MHVVVSQTAELLNFSSGGFPLLRTSLLAALALLAFAGNSLLCRVALRGEYIDPVGFTMVRLFSGALILILLARIRLKSSFLEKDRIAAVALFIYALCFTFSYLRLSAGTGALLLFAAVQVTMIGFGYRQGERLNMSQLFGLTLAVTGLTLFLLPSADQPDLYSALLMIVSGLAWGIYSIRGKSSVNPLAATAGNFLFALPMIVLLAVLSVSKMSFQFVGLVYAGASGAITSGLGYVLWYAALAGLTSSHAAVLQLSVPLLAALGGILFLGESISLLYIVSSTAVLGGIAIIVINPFGSRKMCS